MKKKFLTGLSLLLLICMILPMATACSCNGDNNNDPNKSAGKISNEDTPLALASEALDGVFNPFYYTSGADGSVIGLTQIGMLTTDKDGNLSCGKDTDSVVLAYSYFTNGTLADYEKTGSYDNYYTEYHFAIKNGIKYSNGADLSIKDVLFNLYVLLDPIYTGSSTLYSVNIRGLNAYRAQSADENQQKQMDQYFNNEAAARITEVVDWCNDESSKREDMTDRMKAVISKAEELFRSELETDWASATSTSLDSYEKYGFTESWQIFLYNEGLITVKVEKDPDTKETKYTTDYFGYDKPDVDHSKEAMIETVYKANMEVSTLSAKALLYVTSC